MDYISLCNDKIVPDRKKVINFIKIARKLMFPGYFEKVSCDCTSYLNKINLQLKEELLSFLVIIFPNNSKIANDNITESFFLELNHVVELLTKDLEAFYKGDPAATDYHEIILTYPGLFAISVYRLAHILYKLKVPYLPRIMTEYAHSKTGIDIHPGADIGESFFIDHGTGIVIGETTVIGNHVRIYQGVTLGAISLGRGNQLKGNKRHPTILDYVTIYSNTTVLGGDTVVGNHVTLGSNIYITESVEDNTIVRMKKVDQEIIKKQ